jgi:hypothetical protein
MSILWHGTLPFLNRKPFYMWRNMLRYSALCGLVFAFCKLVFARDRGTTEAKAFQNQSPRGLNL